MAFVEPLTIKHVINSIEKKEILLPAIQREFVWSTDQIEMLFDSLMRKYPLGSFLFWEVNSDNINSYQFYEFIRNYHQKNNKHNEKANILGEKNITAILDGQQRLTSLYIGLKGSYSYKTQRKRWDNNNAFPERKLYINILNNKTIDDKEYDFKFLTKKEAENTDVAHHWFLVGDILKFDGVYQINDYLIDNNLNINITDKELAKATSKTLYDLFYTIHSSKPINLYLEKDSSLDKVLNIFIRVNSGGTKLSYSDLLLSIATAQWTSKDARNEIVSLVDSINLIGNGFAVDKDFVLKTCLILCNFKDIAFKVDNFNHENMIKIESEWDNITESLQLTYNLLYNFGFSRDTLKSNNAVIPIAYYLNIIGNPKNYITSSKYKEDHNKIFKYIIISLLKRNFSGQPDNILRPIREVIKNNFHNGFPLNEIIDKQKGKNKNYSFDSDEINNLLYYQYGNSFTFSVLAAIYPTLDYRNLFHIDHIFPKSNFKKKKLLNLGVKEEDVEYYLHNYNSIANLQLLEGHLNIDKSNLDFKEWLNNEYPNSNVKIAFMERNYIPSCDLNILNFKDFIEQRKVLITKTFSELIK